MRDIRLYCAHPFPSPGTEITLDPKQAHYLINVMRVQDQESLRIFNGKDGEWCTRLTITSKKQATLSLIEQIKTQSIGRDIHLYFAPLKQSQQSFLIEKATELGVTQFHPILTERTIVRTFKADKHRLTAIEASEQCERLTVPLFNELIELREGLKMIPENEHILLADERRTAKPISALSIGDQGIHIFIGPEGGFTPKEFEMLESHTNVKLIKLHDHVLRAETAALCALSQIVV